MAMEGVAGKISAEENVPATMQRVVQDEWELIEISGAPAGYGRFREYVFAREEKVFRQIDSVMRMRMRRLGQKVEIALSVQATFDPAGRMTDFRTETDLGGQLAVTTGRVRGESLEVITRQGGQVATERIPWGEEKHGFFYEQRLLEKHPMVPGEQRKFSGFLPIFHRVAETTLIAGAWTETTLLNQSKELLPIQSQTTLAGQQFTATLWMDRRGRILKTEEPTLRQTVTRTTKAKALAEQNAAPPDLIAGTVIPLKRKSSALPTARSARYRVRVTGAGDKSPFPDSGAQTCRPGGEKETWDLVVHASNDRESSRTKDHKDLPQAADSASNRYIDQKDVTIRQLAAEVEAAETEAMLARALAEKVYVWITRKDFSTVLATATEVARTRSGDCTEHAVLLAALARARGLPARVVVGLVYVPSLGGFAYHMWNQIWCEGAWRFFDATRPDGRCGAGHIKIADAALDDQSGLTVFLPVMGVMGRTEIELMTVRQDR
jgi:hypothetical protein